MSLVVTASVGFWKIPWMGILQGAVATHCGFYVGKVHLKLVMIEGVIFKLIL